MLENEKPPFNLVVTSFQTQPECLLNGRLSASNMVGPRPGSLKTTKGELRHSWNLQCILAIYKSIIPKNTKLISTSNLPKFSSSFMTQSMLSMAYSYYVIR